MIQFFKMLQELRVPLSWPKRTLTPLLSWEEKLKSAGNLLRLPKIKKRKQEESFLDSKKKLPNSTKSLNKDQVFHLVKITLFTSLSKSKNSLTRMLLIRNLRLTTLNWLKTLWTRRFWSLKMKSSRKKKRFRRSSIWLTSSVKTRLSLRETQSSLKPRRRT